MTAAPDVVVLGVPGSEASALPIEAIGAKAWHLARIVEAGIAVPPGFVLPTSWCQRYLAEGEALRPALAAALRQGLATLERTTRRCFGSPRDPLLVSVRSGAAVSMPGMLDTVLNVGLSPLTLGGLLRWTGHPRFCWDAWRRVVEAWLTTVRGLPAEPLERALAAAMARASVPSAAELDARALRGLAEEYLTHPAAIRCGGVPDDPFEQLAGAAMAVLRSWRSPRAEQYRRMHGLSDTAGTAVLVQAMVFGNLGGTSGSGVAFTRNPATGDPGLYGDFLFDAQGEDVVSGRRTAFGIGALETLLPAVHAELCQLAPALERLFGDAQDLEFTVEEGRLWVLQSRSAKRTPWAALRIAVDLAEEGLISVEDARRQLAGLDLGRIVRHRLVAEDGQRLLGRGIPASPGVATGVVAFTSGRAAALARQGRKVILMRPDTSTADLPGLTVSSGVVTAEGSRTSHAAVVARQLGIAGVVGCRALVLDAQRGRAQWGDVAVQEGDVISVDGESGGIFFGVVRTQEDRPTDLLARLAAYGEGVALAKE